MEGLYKNALKNYILFCPAQIGWKRTLFKRTGYHKRDMPQPLSLTDAQTHFISGKHKNRAPKSPVFAVKFSYATNKNLTGRLYPVQKANRPRITLRSPVSYPFTSHSAQKNSWQNPPGSCAGTASSPLRLYSLTAPRSRQTPISMILRHKEVAAPAD